MEKRTGTLDSDERAENKGGWEVSGAKNFSVVSRLQSCQVEEQGAWPSPTTVLRYWRLKYTPLLFNCIKSNKNCQISSR
jgi:hypothetical protein